MFIRSGSSRKIAIEIITHMRDGSMYLPAVQEIPYFNKNVALRDRKLIRLLPCSLVFNDSARLFSDVIGPHGGKLQR